MIYKHFSIANFKGIDSVSINLAKDDLVLLLGLNESGKTTILKAIETFDYLNDPSEDYKNEFFRSIRNKSDINSNESATITAKIEVDGDLTSLQLKKFYSENTPSHSDKILIEDFIKDLKNIKEVVITRVIPFKDGNPLKYKYRIETDHGIYKTRFSHLLGKELVKLSPFIIYFEDFKDRIPEKIYTVETNDAFNPDWYDIIDGLFYNTNKDYSISQFKKFYSRKNPRHHDAATVLKRVNKTLNTSFSDKWKELSGVKDIEETGLKYNEPKAYFEISITDRDGTTFSVDERSKGALWYLSFLMKTEFRRKKLRKNSGKPIFLIDEPASNLHSTAQQNMITDFRKLVEDTSVIYSTHSQYLISLENIKNTYIIERNSGQVLSTLWSDYIKSSKANETYYQPLANLLQLVPNTFVVPWQKAIITEGPSDMKVIRVMYELLCTAPLDFVIYPGTSAQNLSPIISLNIGWGSNFKVLLDSDKEGIVAQEKYITNFDLDQSIILTLPKQNSKIESYFTKDEQKALYQIAFEKEKKTRINKKEFSAVFSILLQVDIKRQAVLKVLTRSTIENFKTLFDHLNLEQPLSNKS